MIQALEDGGTDHSTVVATPPNNHPIELLDEVYLASCLIRSNDRAELRIVPFDRRVPDLCRTSVRPNVAAGGYCGHGQFSRA